MNEPSQIAAVHESLLGPSRRFAAAQQLGRFWREADINRQAEPSGLVANALGRLSRQIADSGNIMVRRNSTLSHVRPRLAQFLMLGAVCTNAAPLTLFSPVKGLSVGRR